MEILFSTIHVGTQNSNNVSVVTVRCGYCKIYITQ